MRKQVAMARNGQLCVVVPLFTEEPLEELTALPGFRMSVSNSIPIAYIVDVGGKNRPVLFNADAVEEILEILGEL